MNERIKAGADIHAGDGGYNESTQEKYDAFVKIRNKSLAQARIRELKEQAGITTNLDTGYFEKDPNKWVDYFAEKFAELIVRECCDVLTENVEVALDASGSPVYPEGLIYEHFGVEE